MGPMFYLCVGVITVRNWAPFAYSGLWFPRAMLSSGAMGPSWGACRYGYIEGSLGQHEKRVGRSLLTAEFLDFAHLWLNHVRAKQFVGPSSQEVSLVPYRLTPTDSACKPRPGFQGQTPPHPPPGPRSATTPLQSLPRTPVVPLLSFWGGGFPY